MRPQFTLGDVYVTEASIVLYNLDRDWDDYAGYVHTLTADRPVIVLSVNECEYSTIVVVLTEFGVCSALIAWRITGSTWKTRLRGM